MGELRQMDQTGDTRVDWDPANPEEIAAARATFESLRNKGYFAYKVGRHGDKGEQIREFDAHAEKIILAPPMAGGVSFAAVASYNSNGKGYA